MTNSQFKKDKISKNNFDFLPLFQKIIYADNLSEKWDENKNYF